MWKDCPGEHNRAPITSTSARGVTRCSLRHLGHPARALDLVPKTLCVFVALRFDSIPSL